MKRISRLLRQLIPEKTKRAVRRKVDRFAARKGYPRIDRAHPVDFRDLVATPVEAIERAPGYPVLVSVPVDRCRGLGLMAFPLCPDSHHPHVLTARMWQRDQALSWVNSPLNRYYQAVTPHSAADVLGLPGAECTPALAAMDALCATLPWIGVPGTVARLRRLQLSRNEMSQYGEEPLAHPGWLEWGPIPARRGELELQRVARTTESIAVHGYRPRSNQGFVRATILVRDKDYTALITAGQHRVAAVAALEQPFIALHVPPAAVVNRADHASWPAVTAGLLTPEQALTVFDRIFEGRQPPFVDSRWPLSDPLCP